MPDRSRPLAALLALVFFLTTATPLLADLDVDDLARQYRQFDGQRNEGRGHSDDPNSGALGWMAAPVMLDYARMWRVTDDPYWLGKIAEHFQRIMDNAQDHYNDGYRTWVTRRYSAAVAYAERLHNVSDARISPSTYRERAIAEAGKATGRTYLIEFPDNAHTYRVRSLDDWGIIADDLPYESGAAIDTIKPFTFRIEGETHQGDRFLVRTIAPQPLAYVVHQGNVIYPVAVFIEAVKSDPDLDARFGDTADTFLAFINTHIFERHDRNWLDLGERGGAYRFEPHVTDRYPNRILPHNQYAAIARAWFILKDLDHAHPDMVDRAEQMARYFRASLHRHGEHDAYVWHYWDWIERGESHASFIETAGYGELDIPLAVTAYEHGTVFTDRDMQRFANTWLKLMWNGEEFNPRMSNAVDGSGDHTTPALNAGWAKLARFDPRIYDLALTDYRSREPWQQVRDAPLMLDTARRAGRLDR